MVDGPALPPIRSSDAERGRCIDVLRDAVVRAGELPTRSAWRSLFGTIVLDLREVRLGGPAIELHLFSLFGTTTVLVPPGIAVEVQGGGPFASRVIEPPPWPAAPMRRGCASRFPGPRHCPNRPPKIGSSTDRSPTRSRLFWAVTKRAARLERLCHG